MDWLEADPASVMRRLLPPRRGEFIPQNCRVGKVGGRRPPSPIPSRSRMSMTSRDWCAETGTPIGVFGAVTTLVQPERELKGFRTQAGTGEGEDD